jgi:hypothetical protein
MKKFKLKKRKFKPNKVYSPEKLLKCIIDSELRPYGKVLEDINTEENGIINGLKWFEYYTFKTPSQERVWYEYCNKLIRKHWLPWYISKKEADKHLSMVRLNYGLKSEYIISKLEKNEN